MKSSAAPKRLDKKKIINLPQLVSSIPKSKNSTPGKPIPRKVSNTTRSTKSFFVGKRGKRSGNGVAVNFPDLSVLNLSTVTSMLSSIMTALTAISPSAIHIILRDLGLAFGFLWFCVGIEGCFQQWLYLCLDFLLYGLSW